MDLIGAVVWVWSLILSFLDDETGPMTMRMTHIFHRNLGGANLHGVYEIGVLDHKAGTTVSSGRIRTKRQAIGRLSPQSQSRFLQQVEAVGSGTTACGEMSIFSQKWVPEWVSKRLLVPDIEDKETVVTVAELAANAYVPVPHQGDWTNVSRSGWEHDGEGFGWMDDGIRGYVFVSTDESIVVISLKGTSAAVFDDGGPTAPNDKINDNLFFSCCCSRVSYMWNTVCDCYMGQDKHTGEQLCDENCLERELYSPDRYYRGALEIYENVLGLYPDSQIWVTGHSLGGALSSMVGRTYGLPVVTFEAPGDALAVRRLHLPQPPVLFDDHVWQFGHNADPIYTGNCNGAGSTCWLTGYAMESRCHTGLECAYDVVGDLGWRSSIANHRIHVVIDDVLLAYNETARCRIPDECHECKDWRFVDLLQEPEPTRTTLAPEPTTTTPTSRSTEPTESVCVTRAWYGRCLDWEPATSVTGTITVGTPTSHTTRTAI